MYLPRADDEKCSLPLQAATYHSVSETVLLVEDEPAIVNMGKTMLEYGGYKVFAVSTAEEALKLVREGECRPDILITDVVMSGLNGKELSDRISYDLPTLKTLYMSGYTADIIAERGVITEGIHFLQKPFTRKLLLEKVRAVLDNE